MIMCIKTTFEMGKNMTSITNLLYNNEIKDIKTRHNFRVGDMICVHLQIKEGVKERIQLFEGLCIAKSGTGLSETFTVRRANMKGRIERIFPIFMPSIKNIVVRQSNKVRRAKLYYLRYLSGKKARLKKI